MAPLGWRITAICSLVALLETTAVGMVGGALTDVQDTFGLNDTFAGLIPSAAIVGSLLVAVPAAHLADRGRRIVVLASAAVLWSLASVGSALAPVFAVFLLTRVAIGAAAQLNNPAASSLIADAHPAGGRARAYGYERMANYLGLPLGIAVGAAVANAIGWRQAFALLAVPGLVMAAVAMLVGEPPRGFGDRLDRKARDRAAAGSAEVDPAEATGPRGEDADDNPTAEGVESEGLVTLAQVRSLWAIPTMRILLVGMPVLLGSLASLFFWSTKYFQDVHGLSESDAGAIAGGVGGTCIVVGIIAGGRLGDRHHGARTGWRLGLAGTALVLGALAFAAMLTFGPLVAQVVGFGAANVFIAMAVPNLTAAVADVVPAQRRGMAFSALQVLVALASALGPPLVGLTSDALGSLRPAMVVLVVPLVGAGLWVRRGAHTLDEDSGAVLDAV